MEPVTLSVVSGVAFWAYDRLRQRAAQDPNNIPDPPELDPAVVNQGTHCLGPTRVFDHDIARGLERVLHSVSAVRVDAGQLGERGIVYRVLPLKKGEPSGADVIRHARLAVPGCVVVASLTLPILFLPLSQVKPAMLLIVAPPGSESLAGKDGHFAVLLPAPAVRVETAPEAPAPIAPEPAPSTPIEEAPAPVATATPFPPPPTLTVEDAIRASIAKSNGANGAAKNGPGDPTGATEVVIVESR